LYSCVTTKIYELQEWLKREGLHRTELALRVDTRVRHLRGRLHHLTEAGLCTTSNELSDSVALHKQLDTIELLAASMQSEAGTQQPKLGSQESEREQGSYSEGSSSTNGVSQAIQSIAEAKSASITHTSVHSFQAFQKLPNPVGYLLKELPIVDGNDARLL
jgi:hypothetical protein